MKYFDDVSGGVKTFSATVPVFGTTTSSLQGIFLPSTTAAVAVSVSEDRIFYLDQRDGFVNGITADFENKKQSNIFTLPFGEFNVSWPAKTVIALLTKPSALADGFLYFLNPQSKKFEKTMGGIKGLTTLVSLDGERIIYSQSKNKTIETNAFTTKDKKSTTAGLATLPEKCVWSSLNKGVAFCAVPKEISKGDYPDIWYQGLVSFNDSVWKADFVMGETELIDDKMEADIINPFLDKSESHFFFINKKDNSLWSLKLK